MSNRDGEINELFFLKKEFKMYEKSYSGLHK